MQVGRTPRVRKERFPSMDSQMGADFFAKAKTTLPRPLGSVGSQMVVSFTLMPKAAFNSLNPPV